ncbi:MAG: histidine kinase dimerization/phospho-acceptor domain-containing protein, partial [Eubacteriales bacterium]|nr:histidine kinase dimerization/phospho-acceptor domain-containing protein [Eubacteriales bacterium]
MKELAYNVYTKWGLRFFLALIFSLILRHFLILKKIVLLDAKGRWVFTNGFLQSKFQDLDRILFALLFFFFLYVLYRIDLDLTQRINSELESLITVIKEEQDSVSLTIDEFIYIKDSIEAEKTGRKQAEASEKQKDRLLKLQIAYLNHDIKTPISIIKSNSEMLQRELNDPKAKEKLRRIEGSLEDMLDLVDELQEVISSWTSK